MRSPTPQQAAAYCNGDLSLVPLQAAVPTPLPGVTYLPGSIGQEGDFVPLTVLDAISGSTTFTEVTGGWDEVTVGQLDAIKMHAEHYSAQFFGLTD